MKYLSTRGGKERLSFEQAVLTGLAPNGGLYIPETIPALPEDWQTRWASLPFASLSFEILSLFIPTDPAAGGIPPQDLKALVERSYATFRAQEVVPLERLAEHEWCLELWHGPTFAFKDVALQLLGNLFEYFLQRRNQGKPPSSDDRERLTVVGATSGDTGSAAIAGLRSKADISIFILHPKGRVSPIQEAQMTTVLDENVHNVAVEGTFDDCQDIVKALFSDKEFNAKHRLGAINSINWARILAQIVYYFAAYFSLRSRLGLDPHAAAPELQFVVPTGNFGDILAGYYAKRMGLPSRNLVVATNENDILQRFWATGRYEKNASSSSNSEPITLQTEPTQGSCDGAQAHSAQNGAAAAGVKATLSPAMDILVSSNFERLLWYLALESQQDNADVQAAGAQLDSWMAQLKTDGRIIVSDKQLELARRDFSAERVSDQEIKDTILRYFSSPSSPAHHGPYLIDPHTAVGFEAAGRVAKSNTPNTHQIVLSTAHPAKFSEAVTSSLVSAGATFDFEADVLPPEMRGLLQKERRVIDVRVGPKAGLDGLIDKTKEVIERASATGAARAGAKGTESM